MAWFGDHLSSLTGKLSDFTKEVLADNRSTNDEDIPGSSLSEKSISHQYQDKDSIIEQLSNEKICLEKSIEELDQQHQEAVNELIFLKNQALKENSRLKEKLAQQTLNVSDISLSLLENLNYITDLNNQEARFSNVNSKFPCDAESVSIVDIILNCLDTVTINNYIASLESKKFLLEAKAESANDSYLLFAINKINKYILFLNQVSKNTEHFLPIFNEISSLFKIIVSDNVKLKEHVKDDTERSNDNVVNKEIKLKSDFACQVFVSYNSICSQTDFDNLCETFENGSRNSPGFTSICLQTEDLPDVHDVLSSNSSTSFEELEATICNLEQEKSDLSEELTKLQSQLQRNSSSVFTQTEEIHNALSSKSISAEELGSSICILEREKSDLSEDSLNLPKEYLSVSSQTDDVGIMSTGHNVLITELEATIAILEQEKMDLTDELAKFQSVKPSFFSTFAQTEEMFDNSFQIEELHANILILEEKNGLLQEKVEELQSVLTKTVSEANVQTDNYKCECSFKLKELENCISILKQEKLELCDRNKMLETKFNRSTSAVLVQTEVCENESEIAVEELEAQLCILDQEKEDLQQEILELRCVLEKETTSVITQTDESVTEHNIPELVANICILEQDKEDLQHEILELRCALEKETSTTTTQTDNSPFEPNIPELIANINILEQEKEDLQQENLELRCALEKETSYVTTQTDDSLSEHNIPELVANISILEQEKEDLQQGILELRCALEKETFFVATQTDDTLAEHNIPDLITNISILEQEKEDLQQGILELRCALEKETSFVATQTDDTLAEYNIPDLIASISILEQENEDLQQEILDLRCALERPTSSIDTQTDDSFSEYDIPELLANICVLEQEKQNLQNEILSLQAEFHRSTSDIAIQIDNDCHQCALFSLEISNLKNTVSEKDNEQAKFLEDFSNQLNEMVNTIETKMAIIDEKSNCISSLECYLNRYKNGIKCLSDKLNSSFCNSNTGISEIEIDYDDILEKINSQLDEVICTLEIKNSVIDQNNKYISVLEHDLEKLKNEMKCLSSELASSVSLFSVETQTTESYCSSESKISNLTKLLDENEERHHAFIKETTLSINSLKQNLQDNTSLLVEKEYNIHSLNSELEKYKENVKNLTNEINLIKAATQSCSCKTYESEIEKLRKMLTDKEKILTTTQNQMIHNINGLKELLSSKEILLGEKECTIKSLKLELEESKCEVKHLLNDVTELRKKRDYAKDIDTSEHISQQDEEGCNRCKNMTVEHNNDLKNEIKALQEKLKVLDLDKSKLLCVLSEKSQECSNLKAEVHKLTNIVASEKQALFKLQQDNCLLKESKDNSDPELTKEAIQKLSRIIRDKDLEIESLKEKNATLTTLIQDPSSVPEHMQSLLEEKENLAKQINLFKTDRDKIMLRYNTVDKDCQQYAAEVKELQSALSEQKEKFEILEQNHFTVAQLYEEKQKSLINTQNEMIALKQRVTDLEQQQVDIKEKYSEMLNKFNSDSIVHLSKEELEEKNSVIERLTNSNSEKDHLIEEKDYMIHDLSQQVKSLKMEHEQQAINLSNLELKIDELTSSLKEQEALVQKLQNEKEAFDLRLQNKNSEFGLLKEMNERLNMNLKEKEFTIQSMTEKLSSLSHYISMDHSPSDTVDINKILADSELMFSRAQDLCKERDETLLALNQSKQENQSLRNEIQRMKSNEIHLKKELERLRMHLLEIEENYTNEALKAEEREKVLRDELVEVKRRADISNTAIVDTNQRASIQIASLQEQLSLIANQRDQALAQVSNLEDKVQEHSTSVSKLQLVLEQMQRENERKIKETERKFLTVLEKQKDMHKELENQLRIKEMQLEESSQALEAASRLSEQLDAKEEMITHLKEELSKTENKIKSTTQEIDTIRSNTEGKVDRIVMKSLVLGYFSTPPGQKSEVVRLLARVLDFNQEEMEKAGIVVGRNAQKNEQKGLLSSIFGRLPSLSAERNTQVPEKSFTTLFVQFLENESRPVVPMPFPAEQMVQELTFKSHSKKSPTSQRKELSRSNPLLLDIDSAFPTFSPVPAVEYSQSPAPSILREVLE